MAERAAGGPQGGCWSPHGDGALKSSRRHHTRAQLNTRLWLTGWTKTISGGEVVSLLVEIANKAGRPRR